ncbi:orexin/Hypocretin receptor type 1-like [Phlebotomus argentipes]|uniref:orexin/Hypocretin receptor type 1-like n=1 Tax=Phlebotomus argentipes TaxID=94469 RepID=UPI002892B831|nr:orexin/Hypocretin receptor type 1-like [Phlebotomus argentipes]
MCFAQPGTMMMHQCWQLLIILTTVTVLSCASRDASNSVYRSERHSQTTDHRTQSIHRERTRRSHLMGYSESVEHITENNTALSSEDIDQYFVDLMTAPAATSHILQNATCIEHEDPDCVINHNITCVGDPVYCNLTYDEYMSLLYDYIYPTIPEWILIFSHSIVFVMGLVGNALVCIAVYTNHSMRTVTNIFIVNLAVADFFVILFCLPPTVVWDVTETWFMGKTMCKIVLYFQTVSVTVSVLTLTFISIDRWYAICFPLRYVSTNERAIGSIAFIWLVALISDIPEFLTLTTQHKQLRFGSTLFTQCVAQWDNQTEKNFHIARFVMLYTLPLLIMTIAYFQIVRVLWKSDTIPGHRESRHHQQYNCAYLRNSAVPANSGTMGQLRMRRKAAKMLVAVVVMFACCYFPVNVLNVLRYTIDIGQSEIISVLSLFSHWLCYANSAVNPVIYNFMSGKFRREFKNALEKCRCCGSGRGRVEDRSMYHSAHTPGTRLNNVSPSSRSNYQLASVRDFTRQQTIQTSFIENGHNNHHQTLLGADEKATRRSSRP